MDKPNLNVGPGRMRIFIGTHQIFGGDLEKSVPLPEILRELADSMDYITQENEPFIFGDAQEEN